MITKYLKRLFLFLTFISIASAVYLFYNPKNNNAFFPLQSPTSTIRSSTPEDLKPARLESNPNNPSQDINKKTENKITLLPTTTPTNEPIVPPPTEDQTSKISTTFIIDNKEYRLTVSPEATAYDAMIQLQELKQISFSSKKFSGLGYFIEEINGIKNSPSNGFYWTLYINNQEAKVGVSNYTIKPNDIITWKYIKK